MLRVRAKAVDRPHVLFRLTTRENVTELDSSRCGIYTWSDLPVPASKRSTCASCHLVGGEFPVTKKEIVKTISEEIGLTQLKTKEIVQKTFDAIVEALVEERRIELRNFGVFEVKERAARKARNPRTGERVDVPEKMVVTFKPGKEMEEKVRQLEAARKARQAAAHAVAAQPSQQASA
jgi:integration host factor subunit beta